MINKLKVIWFSMLMLHLLFPFLGKLLTMQENAEPVSLDESMKYVYISIAIIDAIMAITVSKFLISKIQLSKTNLNQTKLDQETLKKILTAMVIRYALLLSATLTGFVHVMVSHNLVEIIPFVSLGLGIHLLNFPTEEKLKNLLPKN